MASWWPIGRVECWSGRASRVADRTETGRATAGGADAAGTREVAHEEIQQDRSGGPEGQQV